MSIPPSQPTPQQTPPANPVEPPRQQVVWEVPVRIPWVSYTLFGINHAGIPAAISHPAAPRI